MGPGCPVPFHRLQLNLLVDTLPSTEALCVVALHLCMYLYIVTVSIAFFGKKETLSADNFNTCDPNQCVVINYTFCVLESTVRSVSKGEQLCPRKGSFRIYYGALPLVPFHFYIFQEAGRQKCHQYFPVEEGEQVQFEQVCSGHNWVMGCHSCINPCCHVFMYVCVSFATYVCLSFGSTALHVQRQLENTLSAQESCNCGTFRLEG